jgi:hypothetical protein
MVVADGIVITIADGIADVDSIMIVADGVAAVGKI